MMPAAHLLESHNYATVAASVAFNVGAAWLRYASIATGSYCLSLVSGVLLGLATSAIMPVFALLPHRWFAPSRQAFATSITCQSNYAGWGLGTLIPLVVSDEPSMHSFMLAQAVVATLTLPLFVCYYRAEPELLVGHGLNGHQEHHPAPTQADPCSCSASLPELPFRSASPFSFGIGLQADATSHPRAGTHSPSPRVTPSWTLRDLLSNGQFWIHSVAYGLLAGISYTIPAIQANAFSDCSRRRGVRIRTSRGRAG